MTNLLHISSNKYRGIDKSNHTYKIWNELAKGVDRYYVLARSEKNKFECFQDENITLILIPKIINQARVFIFTSLIVLYYVKRFKITHILCQSAIFGGLACVLAKKIYKVKLMIEIHGEEYFRIMNSSNFLKNKIGLFLIKIYKSADKVRSLNSFMTSKLKKLGITDNVVEIYNRVNLDLFNLQKDNFKVTNTLKLISVGRFVKEKNYENLILFLKKTNLNFHLTLIGGGELREKYVDLITNNNLKENILLIDWINQDQIVELIVNSDIYIQPSISEGMPRTIIEAMALQLPIIATNVGSIKGVITNEVNGLLVDPIEDDIIDAVIKMSNSETLRENLAKNARKDVLEKYEWNSVFNKYRTEIINM